MIRGLKRFKGWGLLLAPIFISSCSVTAVRPAQEMSDMEVALRSASEVNAVGLAPEIFRMASELALAARKEYRVKNFERALALSNQARTFAERAEFEALRNGAKREAVPADPLAEPSYAPEPIAPRPVPATPEGGGTEGTKTEGVKTPAPSGPK